MITPTAPLKRLVTINARTLPEDTSADRAFRYVDIGTCGTGRLMAAPTPMTFSNAPSRARRLVETGDCIVSTVRTYLRAVWQIGDSADDLVVSTGFAVLHPGPALDPGYLGWLAQSDVVIEEVVARSVGVSYPSINPSEIGQIRVPSPNLERQRAVARFLEREIEAIDRTIALRQEQEACLDEREFALVSSLVTPSGTALVRLKYLATIQSGLTVDQGRDVGADSVTRPYLRVANVHADSLALESVTEITVPRALAARCTLRYGDVLMTEGGDLDKLGRGTMWRGELPGALHQNHVFAVRPRTTHLESEFLALLTRTQHARAYFEMTGSQTTGIATTSSDKILNLPVPRLDLMDQRRIVEQANRSISGMSSLRAAIRRQVALLQERRQALITAAVTGQLEIPGVAA